MLSFLISIALLLHPSPEFHIPTMVYPIIYTDRGYTPDLLEVPV
jgi:hypothetical protein